MYHNELIKFVKPSELEPGDLFFTYRQGSLTPGFCLSSRQGKYFCYIDDNGFMSNHLSSGTLLSPIYKVDGLTFKACLQIDLRQVQFLATNPVPQGSLINDEGKWLLVLDYEQGVVVDLDGQIVQNIKSNMAINVASWELSHLCDGERVVIYTHQP
jgi:hypothetical protein